MFKYLMLLAFLASCSVNISLGTSPSREIDAGYLKTTLQTLVGDRSFVDEDGNKSLINSRLTLIGRLTSVRFIKSELEKMGYPVTVYAYFTGEHLGTNIVATKLGTSREKEILISAHLDATNIDPKTGKESPEFIRNAGADDNGTGVAAVLAIAKQLRDVPVTRTIKFVLFDQEELGYVGSEAYLESVDTSKVYGNINLDMLGYNEEHRNIFNVADCRNAGNDDNSTDLKLAFLKGVGTAPERANLCIDETDSNSFWDKDIPSVTVSEDLLHLNPHMHKDDEIKYIDFDYFTKVVSAVKDGVLGLVTTPVSL